jgi:hypothetical protein
VAKYKIIGNKKVMGKVKGDTITIDDKSTPNVNEAWEEVNG